MHLMVHAKEKKIKRHTEHKKSVFGITLSKSMSSLLCRFLCPVIFQNYRFRMLKKNFIFDDWGGHSSVLSCVRIAWAGRRRREEKLA